jgi:hypothetical protein
MTKGQDCNGTAARLFRAACIPGRSGCTLSQTPGAAGAVWLRWVYRSFFIHHFGETNMNLISTATAARLRPIVVAACLLALAAPVPPALAVSWGGGEQVQGSGTIRKQAREVAHFNGLLVAVPGQVELRLGSTEGVTIETDDNLLPLVETVVEDGTLQIRPARKGMNLHTRTLKIVVQARSIERLALGGSGSIDADALRGTKLQFDIGGSGSIKVKGIEAETVAVSVGGSGDLKAGSGAARRLSVSIGGSGDVDLGQLRSDTVSVSVAGSGEATVWAREALSMTIAGSGDVNYYGDPKVSKSVVGSGGARRLGCSGDFRQHAACPRNDLPVPGQGSAPR